MNATRVKHQQCSYGDKRSLKHVLNPLVPAGCPRPPLPEYQDGRCGLLTPLVSWLASSYCCVYSPHSFDHLVGLGVKSSASREEDPGFESRLRRDFSGSRHTSDSKIGTLGATLPSAWRYRVSAGSGRPGVSIL